MNSPTVKPMITEEPEEMITGIRRAFELFDDQSQLLQLTFENLRKNLALTNAELNTKNVDLSDKVEELQQMSSRLHCILESLADGVFVVNDKMLIERCNPAAAKLLNRARSDIEGKPYKDVMNGLGKIEALCAAIKDGETLFDEQRRCKTENGGSVIVLASVAPIRSNHAILGAVEVLRDVTQLRMLEGRVQHQQRVHALGEMAASVAHEIRNPLGTIEGFARLLKRRSLIQMDLKSHSRMASKIIEGAVNLNYVITNLLNFARPMSLQCEPIEINTLFNSVRDLLASKVDKEKLLLKMPRTDRSVQLNGDIRQLRQVLVNLGLNACEACGPGGSIEFRIQRRQREVQISVSDNGCGIPVEDIPKVFDPFFTNKHGGTGLGLSLCHKIISAHSGEIMVKSNMNKGTLFKITLPAIGKGNQ